MSNSNEQNNVSGVVNEVLKIFNNNWNRQVILYGPPGTSKTYSAKLIAASFIDGKEPYTNIEAADDYLGGGGKEQFKLIQFHPSYSYEDFVRGITVKTDEKNNLEYKTESKIFENFCIEANNNKDKKYVLIIDEINRAPLATVLGELIYGLEYRGKTIETPYKLEENKGLVIPENLYIIGTMNTADRSIGGIDYAVRRRFAFVNVTPNPDTIKGTWTHIGESAKKLYDEIEKIFTEENLTDPDMDPNDIKIGHTYFLGNKGNESKEAEKEYLEYRFKYQIEPIIKEYISDGLLVRDKCEEILNNAEGVLKFEEDTSSN